MIVTACTRILFKSFVIRRPIHPADNGRHAQQLLNLDNPIPLPGIMLPTANSNSVWTERWKSDEKFANDVRSEWKMFALVNLRDSLDVDGSWHND